MMNAEGFAPGHVTGVFVPVVEPKDPLARGSLGAGLVLDKGAWATVKVRKADRPVLHMFKDGGPARLPVTAHALRSLLSSAGGKWSVETDVSHELPVAQGLGMSAAGTLAASVALAQALNLTHASAVRAAHLAELECHGGLGGISAILGGGVEVRRKAGLPPLGIVERTRSSTPLLIAFLARPLPSPPLLSNPAFLRRVREAGEDLLGELPSPPVSVERLFQVSSRFTDALGLAPPLLRKAIDTCRESGALIAQAMLGHTLFIRGADRELRQWLVQKGFRVVDVRVGSHGPQVRSLPSGPRQVRGTVRGA
jgi:pantoate kinase